MCVTAETCPSLRCLRRRGRPPRCPGCPRISARGSPVATDCVRLGGMPALREEVQDAVADLGRGFWVSTREEWRGLWLGGGARGRRRCPCPRGQRVWLGSYPGGVRRRRRAWSGRRSVARSGLRGRPRRELLSRRRSRIARRCRPPRGRAWRSCAPKPRDRVGSDARRGCPPRQGPDAPRTGTRATSPHTGGEKRGHKP